MSVKRIHVCQIGLLSLQYTSVVLHTDMATGLYQDTTRLVVFTWFELAGINLRVVRKEVDSLGLSGSILSTQTLNCWRFSHALVVVYIVPSAYPATMWDIIHFLHDLWRHDTGEFIL